MNIYQKKKLINCGTNIFDLALWQYKFAVQIFAILWTIRKKLFYRITKYE